MKIKNDTLFDGNFTWLDGMKIALLVLTMFSTWSIVDLVTPDVPLAFVRELAATGGVCDQRVLCLADRDRIFRPALWRS